MRPKSAHARDDVGGAIVDRDAATWTNVDPEWAWSAFEPDAQRPWNWRWAAHLYRRAGFGARWSQLERAVEAGPGPTIEGLLHPATEALASDAALDRDEAALAGTAGMESLRAWWLRRMVQTGHPLREKMTLFWHSHFGAQHARVKVPALMVQHAAILREHALGSYRQLLEAVSHDAAMLLALGGDANRRAAPNELFARQWLEQFSLGAGHYDEEDVREVARTFTGWFVMRGQLRYFAHEFDEAPKRIRGQEGPWKPEDAVRIVLAQPAAPRLLVRKLFRWLISEEGEPGDGLLDPLARQLEQDYDIGQVVATVLRSNLFFSDRALRQRVKSPVEYALGIVLALEQLVPTLPLGAALAELGQDLYTPPTTAGWPGGRHWLTPATVVGRANLAEALLAPGGPYGGKLDPAAITRRLHADSAEEQVRTLVRLLWQEDVPPAVETQLVALLARESGDKALRGLVCEIATWPEYQLC
jgi:uncharacterized protein (DUF1800 family)